MTKYMALGLAFVVAHGSLGAATNLGLPAFITAQAFFKASWKTTPNPTNTFVLTLRWMPDIPMTSNGKHYKIRSGIINYMLVQRTGTLNLLEEDASGKLQPALSSGLTSSEFKNFSSAFHQGEKEGNFTLETPTTQGPELKDYELIKDLLRSKFPGLQIG